MTDTRERFLREIADRLPPERIEEVHLFPPLRQGGVESGVAVVAAEVEVRNEPSMAGTAEGAEELRRTAEDMEGAEELRRTAEDAEGAEETRGLAESAANLKEPDLSVVSEGERDAGEASDVQVRLGDVLADEACDPTEAAAALAPVRVRPRRHTVYTARYRHTLKGPDRGKWEFDIVAEADAPLITVETVVRGVQKRSGELADPERLTPDDLRTALDDTPWRATTG